MLFLMKHWNATTQSRNGVTERLTIIMRSVPFIRNRQSPAVKRNYLIEKLLLHEIKTHKNFILDSVKGDYGEDIYSLIQYAILLDVPKNIRLQRVKKRSFQKFGNRMLSGGDLFEQEEKFFRFVESRNENTNFIIAFLQDKNLLAKEMGNKK